MTCTYPTTPAGRPTHTPQPTLVTFGMDSIVDAAVIFFGTIGKFIFDIFDLTGRIVTVIFETIIYNIPEQIDYTTEDEQRVRDNIEFNEGRGFYNIRSEYIGVIKGYHTWELKGTNPEGNRMTWRIQGWTNVGKQQIDMAFIEEAVSTFTDESEFSGDIIKASELLDKVVARLKEHGMIVK